VRRLLRAPGRTPRRTPRPCACTRRRSSARWHRSPPTAPRRPEAGARGAGGVCMRGRVAAGRGRSGSGRVPDTPTTVTVVRSPENADLPPCLPWPRPACPRDLHTLILRAASPRCADLYSCPGAERPRAFTTNTAQYRNSALVHDEHAPTRVVCCCNGAPRTRVGARLQLDGRPARVRVERHSCAPYAMALSPPPARRAPGGMSRENSHAHARFLHCWNARSLRVAILRIHCWNARSLRVAISPRTFPTLLERAISPSGDP